MSQYGGGGRLHRPPPLNPPLAKNTHKMRKYLLAPYQQKGDWFGANQSGGRRLISGGEDGTVGYVRICFISSRVKMTKKTITLCMSSTKATYTAILRWSVAALSWEILPLWLRRHWRKPPRGSSFNLLGYYYYCCLTYQGLGKAAVP